MRTKQCPACWSTLDIDEVQCPQCDAALKPPGRGSTFITILVIGLAAGAMGLWIQQRLNAEESGGRTAENTPAEGEIDPDRLQSTAGIAVREKSDDSNSDATVLGTPFFGAFGENSRSPVTLIALWQDGPAHQLHYCVPASHLPTREGIVTADGTPFTAITWERRSDLVLLLGPRPDPIPTGFVPLTTRDPRSLRKDEELTVITPRGTFGGTVRRTGFGNHMHFDRGVPPGSIVVDTDGRGLAYVDNRSRSAARHETPRPAGLPLHAIAPWKDWWNGRPLAEVQKEIRAADPDAILADARRLLDASSTTIERAELAIALLTRGQHLATNRVGIAAFDRLIRFAHKQRIRLLSEVSGVRALQQARESLNTLGSDPEILSDAIELAIDYGEPAEALAFYQTLMATSADHARKLKPRLGRKLRRTVDVMLRDSRFQDAARLLADAIRNMPGRADLRMLYAQALTRLGDEGAAEVQARAAVRLDPSYGRQAQRYARSFPRRVRGRRVEVPYDDQSGAILVAGTAGTQALGFVVDTGASYTTIPTTIARALNLLNGKNPVAEVTTAGGVVKAQQVVLRSLTIAGKITIRNVTVMVLDLPGNLSGKGLLGLNVLRGLNMQMDSFRGRLILWKRSKRP